MALRIHSDECFGFSAERARSGVSECGPVAGSADRTNRPDDGSRLLELQAKRAGDSRAAVATFADVPDAVLGPRCNCRVFSAYPAQASRGTIAALTQRTCLRHSFSVVYTSALSTSTFRARAVSTQRIALLVSGCRGLDLAAFGTGLTSADVVAAAAKTTGRGSRRTRCQFFAVIAET